MKNIIIACSMLLATFSLSAKTVGFYAPDNGGTNGLILVSAGDRHKPYWKNTSGSSAYQHNIFCWDTNTVYSMAFSFINDVATPYANGTENDVAAGVNISKALAALGHTDRYTSIMASGNTGSTLTAKGGMACVYGANDGLSFYWFRVTQGSFYSTNWRYIFDTVTPASTSTLAVNPGTSTESLSFDDIYPIGSVYFNAGDTLPPNFTAEGRIWVKLPNDTFLMSTDGSYLPIGYKGGANFKTLVTDYMPIHNHGGGSLTAVGSASVIAVSSSDTSASWSGLSGSFSGSLMYNTGRVDFGTGNTWWYEALLQFSAPGRWSGRTTTVGGSEPFDNRPSYLTISMWKRTH